MEFVLVIIASIFVKSTHSQLITKRSSVNLMMNYACSLKKFNVRFYIIITFGNMTRVTHYMIYGDTFLFSVVYIYESCASFSFPSYLFFDKNVICIVPIFSQNWFDVTVSNT